MRRSLIMGMLVLAAACGQRDEKQVVSGKKGETATAGQAPARVAPASAEVGSVMPGYSAPYLDGKTFDLESRRGKVVFLNLWATWCGPCRYEIPELQKLHDENAARGFEVVGVSVDEGDKKVVSDFVASEKITYPIVHDAEGKLAVLLDTNILPTSVLVDRTGKIIWKKLGIVTTTDADLVKALEQALAQRG